MAVHELKPSVCMQAQNEVAVLALLDHPNVVKYHECFAEQGTKVKIVMELCEVRSRPPPCPARSLSLQQTSARHEQSCNVPKCGNFASPAVALPLKTEVTAQEFYWISHYSSSPLLRADEQSSYIQIVS